MLINEVKQLVEQLAAKNQIGGYLPADEYSNYAYLAQTRAIDRLCQVADRNMHVVNLASDFLKTQLINPINGRATRPVDYYRYWTSSALFVENGETLCAVDYIGLSEWAKRKGSVIVGPTNEFPIATEDIQGIIFAPTSVTAVQLTYAINPTPEWVGEPYDELVFDPNLSTDFVLSSKFKDYLVREIANMFGIEVMNQNLQQATLDNLVEGRY